MAVSMCASSSTSTHQTFLAHPKLDDNLIIGVSSVSLPFIPTHKYTSIRCHYNSGFSSRWACNMEATSTGAPTSVPVRVAHELLLAGHRYLDVRTPEEFSAGRVPGAVNIPYMFRIGSGMTKNPEFLEQVASQFGKDDEILVGCQSGKRSLMAANDLQSAGYTGIIDIAGGYTAWVQSDHATEV